jgi:hypothetical protein
MFLLLLSWLSSSFCKTNPVNNDRGKLQSLRKVPRTCAKIDALLARITFWKQEIGGFPRKGQL